MFAAGSRLEHAMPWCRGLSSFCLPQDGDPTHNSAQAGINSWNFCAEFHVYVLEKCPENGPDPSPIENVRDLVGDESARDGLQTF
jgi:hypothetical protein